MSPQDDHRRFERKAYIDHFDRSSLVSLIRQHPALFRERYKERTINSLYFDTRTFSNAFEKIDGLPSRRKARIRWYGTLFGEIKKPVLEIKAKENSVGWKMRYSLLPFDLEENGGESAIHLQFRKPEDALHPTILMMTLIPSLLISYRRLYFLSADGRFRLTVDDQLKYYRPGMNKQKWIPCPDNPSGIIIELKYSYEDDNDARKITCWYPFRWGSFSKYTTGLGSSIL